jgi:hypothetical protein
MQRDLRLLSSSQANSAFSSFATLAPLLRIVLELHWVNADRRYRTLWRNIGAENVAYACLSDQATLIGLVQPNAQRFFAASRHRIIGGSMTFRFRFGACGAPFRWRLSVPLR